MALDIAYSSYMNQTRTADDVARLFMERTDKLFSRLSEKQVRWIAALASDTKETRRHSHGHNSVHAGQTTYSNHWYGTFCEQCQTRWRVDEAGTMRQIMVDPCNHRPWNGKPTLAMVI